MDNRNINRAKSLSGQTVRRPAAAVASQSGAVVPVARKLLSTTRSKVIAVSVVVAIILSAVCIVFVRPNLFIEAGKYQALFLTNGEVYFGKLRDTGFEYMVLNDVYYIQSDAAKLLDDDSAGKDTPQSGRGQSQLVKLGQETHGPTDRMLIRKENVLYFENLKPDGQVVKLIEQDKAK